MLSQMYPWLHEPTIPAMIVRTLLALICAGLIGYERNVRGAAAGFRTHILVCLGAMLAMSTGQYAFIFYDSVDPTRIGAQVVSGIGFIGAGSIIIGRGRKVSGVTTAAGLWASSCVGLALGIGFYEGAIIGTIAIYFTERVLRRVSLSMRDNRSSLHDTSDPDGLTVNGSDIETTE